MKLDSYLGLPPLAGVCAPQEAVRAGYGVEENVARLKRYHYTLKRVWEILLTRINPTPIYELKMGYSYHAYLLAENIAGLRGRVSEMREPPLGLDDVPDPALEILFDEIRAADDAVETLTGVYAAALPALRAAVAAHLDATNPLVDQPTVRLLRQLLPDLDDAVAWGRACLDRLAPTLANPALANGWHAEFTGYLLAAGGIDGCSERTAAQPRRRSRRPFRFDPVPVRDGRFADPFNMGVHAERFINEEKFPAKVRDLMLLFKRLREIDVPEMMASILLETPGKPWAYYRDLTRQLWDEARHAMMGEVGFARLGLDWTKTLVRHTFGWELNTLLSPAERHAILFTIETNLMPRTGKRFEWELAREAGDELTATFQDYDWADEVLHARIGRDWYAADFPSTGAAKKTGDAAFAKLNRVRPDYAALGWTQHANWWPEFYRHACAVLGWEHDPAVAAYDVGELEAPCGEAGGRVDLATAGGLSA